MAAQHVRYLTVLEALQMLFPPSSATDGSEATDALEPGYWCWPETADYPRQRIGKHSVPPDERVAYALPPLSPFDLFAFAGYLLEQSGAYHHVVPAALPTASKSSAPVCRVLCLKGRQGHGDGEPAATEDEGAEEDGREDEGGADGVSKVDDDELGACLALARIWRKPLDDGLTEDLATPSDQGTLSDPAAEAEPRDGADTIEEKLARRRDELRPLLDWWDDLLGLYGRAPVFENRDPKKEPHPWWRIALRLFIVADEASRDVGFETLTAKRSKPWFEVAVASDLVSKIVEKAEKFNAPGRRRQGYEWDIPNGIESLSQARRELVCVLPKARTTPVGCTLRSLSHHLALLPGQGIARANWMTYPFEASGSRPQEPEWELNVLLVPYPFTVQEHDFSGHMRNPLPSLIEDRWGYFDVAQTWLNGPYRRQHLSSQLVRFVKALADDATKRCRARRIDAVVFPELALNYKLFRELTQGLARELPQLELVIGGLSRNETDRHGNFVGVSVLREQRTFETIREKHHRWHLDAAQIEEYQLQGVLNPTLDWWENLALLSRRVDFTVFKQHSVLAAMICEDLARVDPCQELLRAIGPNIVVALLMDAPQLPNRWPARYATVLAEDPGSSVLTLTSRGLMTRQHLRGKRLSETDDDRVIALWRDSHHGRPMPIACPYGSHGVWLKLWAKPVTDHSLDGRRDPSSVAWLHACHKPLKVANATTAFAELLGPDDLEIHRRMDQAAAAAAAKG